jgi:hypothetical protein
LPRLLGGGFKSGGEPCSFVAKVRKFVKTARIAPVTSASERTLTSLLVTLL